MSTAAETQPSFDPRDYDITDEEQQLACIYCDCTERNACMTPSGPCSWISSEPPVCSNPECVAKHEAGVPPDFAPDDVDLANPPITDVEASAPAGAYEESMLGEILIIPIDEIDPDPDQARDEGADEDLAPSIAVSGVLQPVRVYPHPDPARIAVGKRWILDDGERRYRGAVKVGLPELPARIVAPPTSLGEKLLRQNLLNDGKRLKPMEEARSWSRIKDDKGWTIEQLAKALGRPKSTVSDRLAMLDAPAPFQELFANGTLGAAAAPVVREFRELPERVLKAVVKDLLDDDYEGWGQFANNGLPVPVKVVSESLENAIVWGQDETGRRFIVEIDKALAKKYTDASTTIRGKKYALAVEAYQAIVVEAHKQSRDKAAAPDREQEKWAIEDAARRKRENAERQRKADLRRAQFDVIAPKLPAKLDANWSLFLVRWLVREIQQDDLRMACKGLNLEPPKKSERGGLNFDKAVVAYAEQLDAAKRVQLALQLLIAGELGVSQYDLRGTERMTDAAKLLKIDLKKIKPPADEKAKKAPAKPVSKKRR